MKQFLKKGQVQLINGGYVVNEKEEPVTNQDFIKAQEHAHYVVTFAEKAKGKDFKGKEADSLAALQNEVFEALYGKKAKTYVSAPKKPVEELGDKLREEALSFINFQSDKEKIDKINIFLNKFNVIAEYEEFGLFFDQGIVKLSKIYTVKEITKAVESVIELL
jgi:hypothetical protein